VLRPAACAALLAGLLAGAAGLPQPVQAGKLESLQVIPPTEPAAPEVRSPEQEEVLLRALCQYLKLSRTQAIHILPIARSAERASKAFATFEAEKQRELNKIGNANPEVSARILRTVEERRAQLLAQTVQMVGPQLTRILTREQIALIWRLQNGQPPRYTNTDPLLLQPAAGFSSGNRRLLQLGGGLSLDIGDGDALQSRVQLYTRSLGLAERQLADASVAVTREQTRIQSGRQQIPTFEVDNPNRVVFAARSEKPFPQLVAETTELADLLPVVEPLARRVFTSDQWLSVLETLVKDGELRGGSARNLNVSLGSLRLLRDYRMEFGFRDLARKGPELEPLGGDLDHGRYRFAPGQGLMLPDAGVTDHYAVQLNFRFFGGDSYQKILDFKNGDQDGGLYFYQGHLTFYTLANGGTPIAGRDHRLRIERNRTTRAVRVFLDLQPIFAFIDLDDAAVFDKSKGILFVDDRSTKGEQGPGEVRSVAVWGTAPKSGQ
jgi:hypothetical protein